MDTRKVPVTTRAVISRINRRLRPDLLRLRACRPNSRWWSDLGDYFIVDLDRNAIVQSHVDPETYGRELGVVQLFEQVAADEPLAVAVGR
ncbi:hypothetical protein NLM31_20990 [Bradyrhizobium sp. CCGUVB4N]|uniref:hypothetical protein n=1 Tax=Bradyrhizobium sp. CCGUVB4N TaxID=2949631 RepID=UPI0020B29BD0|nr:hypothetical protein [Bradyrhizobium sp. CCGUVB4N]MCP3382846.1 hypothetical protein [Bradyrhizobium sp. CCGUVB4N]